MSSFPTEELHIYMCACEYALNAQIFLETISANSMIMANNCFPLKFNSTLTLGSWEKGKIYYSKHYFRSAATVKWLNGFLILCHILHISLPQCHRDVPCFLASLSSSAKMNSVKDFMFMRIYVLTFFISNKFSALTEQWLRSNFKCELTKYVLMLIIFLSNFMLLKEFRLNFSKIQRV